VCKRIRRHEMNLLAHVLLSPDVPGVLVGNLVADWVKGRARKALPAGVRQGMELHGRIDAFTDGHAVVGRCAELLAPNWGRYAPILVDMFFDHVLSVEWGRWCARGREEVIAGAYAALREHLEMLPERARWAACALLADDWLTAYGTLDGMGACLTRMSVRLNMRGHDIELAPAVRDFVAHRDAIQVGFGEFFPELKKYVEQWAVGEVD
jgi:acyl carrier protein phosphodiesterase